MKCPECGDRIEDDNGEIKAFIHARTSGRTEGETKLVLYCLDYNEYEDADIAIECSSCGEVLDYPWHDLENEEGIEIQWR